MNLTDLDFHQQIRLILKSPPKNKALANLSIYYTWKNIKSAHNNNKFKIYAPTWHDTFDLPDRSYSIADIQDYFEFIIKKQETLAENPPVQIYPNKIKNRIVFKITKQDMNQNCYLQKQLNYQGAQKKTLKKIKMAKTYQNQNLLKFFQCIIIQSITIIKKHLKYYLLLCQINNLDS